MKKYKSAYLKPYIRKAKKQDFNARNASSISVCISQANYEGKKAYVLVQRGSSSVILMSESKERLKSLIAVVGFKKNKKRMKKFNKWRNNIKHYCRKD